MSERLTPERLAEFRRWPEECLRDALAHADAQQAEIERLAGQVTALRASLERIQQWDELNPPNTAKIGDAQWLRDLVDAALAEVVQ